MQNIFGQIKTHDDLSSHAYLMKSHDKPLMFSVMIRFHRICFSGDVKGSSICKLFNYICISGDIMVNLHHICIFRGFII